MQVIEIILDIVVAITYGLIAYHATFSYFLLRRMVKKMTALEEMEVANIARTAYIELLLMGLEADKISDTIKELIASEEYEEADRMNEILVAIRQSIDKTVEAFNRNFGHIATLSIKIADSKETKRNGE